MTHVKHYDYAGRPLCDVKPEGAFVVENFEHVTCKKCIQELAVCSILNTHTKGQKETIQ